MGDRRAQQGAALAACATGIGGLGLGQREVFGEADEAVDLRVELGDARQQGAGQFFGGEFLVGESAGDLGQGHVVHCRLFPFSR